VGVQLRLAVKVNVTRDYLAWMAALGALGGAAGLLDNARLPEGDALRLNVTVPLIANVTDEMLRDVVEHASVDHSRQKLIESILPRAVRLNHAGAIAFATECWQNVTANGSCLNAAPGVVPARVQSMVFTNAAMRNASAFDELLTRYNQSTFPSERSRLLGAITRIGDNATRDKLMEMAVKGNGLIRLQDRNGVFSGIAGVSIDNRDAVWNFVTTHFSAWTNTTGAIFGGASGIVASIGGGFASPSDLAAFDTFVAANKAKLSGRDIKQARERIENNILWVKRNEASVADFLASLK